jgi:predicted RNase H-like nuclease (RuvC/YqgF family)
MKMKQTHCSETSAIKHHTLLNNPKDYTQHSQQGESLKSRDSMFSNSTNRICCLQRDKKNRLSEEAEELRQEVEMLKRRLDVKEWCLRQKTDDVERLRAQLKDSQVRLGFSLRLLL